MGAICISLASSWAFGEIFGWAHSLNNKIKQAPWFYASYFFTLVTAGLVVLIPGAPLVLITLFVQVVAVTLLPAALVFLILLLNDKATMGEYCNTPAQNIIGGAIVTAIIFLSTCGLGSALWFSRYSMIASLSSATLLKAPRRMRFRVISAKNRSTMLSQDAEVGVKCNWKRGYNLIQRFTAGVL